MRQFCLASAKSLNILFWRIKILFFFECIAATNKKLHRLNMSVCPKGIECFDAITGETILKVSIYKISYCSADATHANVFAFVAGSKENLAPSEDDPLTCYAFVCAKRKVAHKLTLTVARNFEQAFKQWQESMQRKKHRNQLEEMTNSQKSKNMDNVCGDSSQLVHDNSYNGISDGHLSQLIDFDSELGESQSAQHSQLLQNSWVSFDDEPVIDESKIEVPTTIYENNMWGQDLLCSP